MKKPVKIALVCATVAIICITAGYMLWMPTAVQVQTLQAGVLTQDFTETGKLVPTREVVMTVGVGEVVAGQVAVQEGQRVAKGDLLVTLQPGDMEMLLQNRLEQLQQKRLSLVAQKTMTQAERTVAVEQARSSYQSAKWEYERLYNEDWGVAEDLITSADEDMLLARYTWFDVKEGENDMDANRAHSLYRQALDAAQVATVNYSDDAKLYYHSLVASSEWILKALENNKAAVESVEAAIGELDAAIKLAETQLATSEIRAPFDGVVHSIAVKAGQPVMAGAPLLSVASEQSLQVEVFLLAADTVDLKVGDEALCTLENGSSFVGKVSFVAAAAQERVSTVGIVENRCLVRLEPVDTLPDRVSTGFGVDVKFSVVRAENVYAVPTTALVGDEASGKRLYILNGNRATSIVVETGITASGYTEVTCPETPDALTDGSQIILLPQEAGIKDGSFVMVQ